MANVIVEREQAFFWNVGSEANQAVDVLLQKGINERFLQAATEKFGLISLPTSCLSLMAARAGERLGLGFFREVEITRGEQGQIIRFSLPAETPLNDHTDIP